MLGWAAPRPRPRPPFLHPAPSPPGAALRVILSWLLPSIHLRGQFLVGWLVGLNNQNHISSIGSQPTLSPQPQALLPPQSPYPTQPNDT